MTLEEFVLDNRQELIRRTRGKVAKRSSPPRTDAEMEHGVPLFLSQLVSALREEAQQDPAQQAMPDSPDNASIVRSAILHGQTLRKLGFTIEQVVQLIVRGREPRGWVISMIIGVVGSFLGGFLGRALGWYREGQPAGFVMSLLGAVILVVAYHAISRRRAFA